jgi:transcriptional regulator GlxA family with amidase domain
MGSGIRGSDQREGQCRADQGDAGGRETCDGKSVREGPDAAARTVARRLVLYHRRAGGQSQFSSLLDLQPKSDRIQTALTHARRHLTERLTVEDLADVARLSPRQFSRAFQAETGRTPAKAIESLRLEGARALLEDTSDSLDVVARLTGFGDRDRMRRAFVRVWRQSPQDIRRHACGDTSLQTSGYAES